MLSSPAFELEQWIQTHTQTHTERHSRVASDRHILIFICNAISLSLPHIASQPNKCTHTYMQTQNVVIPLAAPNYEMYGWMMIVWCTVSSMVYSPHRVSVALIAYTVECVAMRSLQIGFAHNVCLACEYGPIPRETVIMHVYSNAGIGSYQPLVLWTVYACVYCAPMACVCTIAWLLVRLSRNGSVRSSCFRLVHHSYIHTHTCAHTYTLQIHAYIAYMQYAAVATAAPNFWFWYRCFVSALPSHDPADCDDYEFSSALSFVVAQSKSNRALCSVFFVVYSLGVCAFWYFSRTTKHNRRRYDTRQHIYMKSDTNKGL